MAKKKKDTWMKDHVKRELNEMRKGEFKLDKQRKIRYKKTRIPKWLNKYNEHGKSSHINFRKTFGRWANNEERIIMEIYPYSEIKLKSISKRSKIDYSNISRYLKSLEKKKLVKIEPDYHFKRMPSGKLKRYHEKIVKLTEKGIKKRKKILGFW